ncbi:hypothetical protein [Pseudonocardia sp. T1-2H]|uniref:hypothetical protein n=1 Tax=Pseudonocardia sp. T1-2H TaxID=3128899 RepID=UPI00310155DF
MPATERTTQVGEPIVRPTPVVEPPFAVPSAMPSVVDTADAAGIAVAEVPA